MQRDTKNFQNQMVNIKVTKLTNTCYQMLKK